jgi:hypothetical protein
VHLLADNSGLQLVSPFSCQGRGSIKRTTSKETFRSSLQGHATLLPSPQGELRLLDSTLYSALDQTSSQCVLWPEVEKISGIQV